MSTRKFTDSSAAFLFEVPGSNLPFVVQELQLGGTSPTGAHTKVKIVTTHNACPAVMFPSLAEMLFANIDLAACGVLERMAIVKQSVSRIDS
jgi:hypothetical protein